MEKKNELYRGKTKAVYTTEDPNLVILENFDSLTKFDNPELTKEMKGKAVRATKTTCNVFNLLKSAGIPVAFERQISETEFLAKKCQMIPLEVIIRRYAVGSYLKRFPHLAKPEGMPPHRFHQLVFELFLKTTGGEIKDFDGRVLDNTLVDDPFISKKNDEWSLYHPKKPSWEEGADLGISIRLLDFLYSEKEISEKVNEEGDNSILLLEKVIEDIEKVTRTTFLVLEGAWAQFGCRLIDFKIEFGITSDGNLVVSDVIDNDSWRLRTSDWSELSKENFRQNMNLEEVSDKYELVAGLTDRFHKSKQAIVFWRESKNDVLPELDKEMFAMWGISFVEIIVSGYKSPRLCLNKLEEVIAEFPEGGVIIPIVGMSNGLGPTLSARTSWPVLAVPANSNENQIDVWSSLSMPSRVPLLTVLSPKNAILAALNILGQKNPFVYAVRQYDLEELDE